MEEKKGRQKLILLSDDNSDVLQNYIKYLANRKLLNYKGIIHTGGKAGESLWTHIINLVTMIVKVFPLFDFTNEEQRCLLLALTVHDINKLDPYGKLPNGRENRYANAATIEHLQEELEALEVAPFFPEWENYLFDIEYLVDAHQGKSRQASQWNQKHLDQCRLADVRLEGPLQALMRVADVSDNSHSGDHTSRDEKRIRDKIVGDLGEALGKARKSRRYRFVGHRLAELRGLETNVIHNQIVEFLYSIYGKDPLTFIDLMYHPEGVDYLLDASVPFNWTPQMQHQLARRIGEQFALLQSRHLAQFIKAKPSGISVDDAALQSGAPLSKIFQCIRNVVERKRYKLEWKAERNTFARRDLEKFLTDEQGEERLKIQVRHLLNEPILVPIEDEALKRGEMLMAYRNFLKDHRAEQLHILKQDAWDRVARLFNLPQESDTLYHFIDPYRRGYVMARDLPERSVDDMIDNALLDLEQLEAQAQEALGGCKGRKARQEATSSPKDAHLGDTIELPAEIAHIVDYLERNLEVWDSTASVPIQPINFVDTLRRYADPKRPDAQCCYCGSPLKAEEWMAIQVPPSIGVQSFSNRLEGGSAREPKRNVCVVCRTQFILEKLAWDSHRDKQGSEQNTFYLHLFPYSYFTQPLLLAWWQSVNNVRQGNYRALFIETRDPKQWERAYTRFQAELHYFPSTLEGAGVPVFSEAISNTPILPLMIKEDNYGKRFLLALEQTILLTLWFDCRVLFSRLPTPLLNLANERIGEEPVALLVENVPQEMSWLLPVNAFTRPQVGKLCLKISHLHALAKALAPGSDQFLTVIYDLVTAAAHDPLALCHVADRLIEEKVAQKKQPGSEFLLTHQVAPLIEELMKGDIP